MSNRSLTFGGVALLQLLSVLPCHGRASRQAASPVSLEALHTDEPLRRYADAAHFRFGAAVNWTAFSQDEFYRRVLTHQFNTVVPEAFMELKNVVPQEGRYSWGKTDAFVQFAVDHGLAVRGQALLYGNALPRWINERAWTREELSGFIESHVDAMVRRYRGKIDTWMVVNEPLDYRGGAVTFDNDIFKRVIGPEYIEIALRAARNADPDAKLFINESGIEVAGPKQEAMLRLLGDYKARGVPIDGVGIQFHIPLDVVGDLKNRKRAVRRTMESIAALGLEVQVTEIDVRLRRSDGVGELAFQGEVFAAMLDVCRSVPACSAYTMWGYTDRYSWVPSFYPGYGRALILDEYFRFKPAYFRLLEVLRRRAQRSSGLDDNPL